MQVILTEAEYKELIQLRDKVNKATAELHSIEVSAKKLLTDQMIDLPCKDAFNSKNMGHNYYCNGCIIGELTPAYLGCQSAKCLAGRYIRLM